MSDNVLKKEFQQKDVQRLRNLMQGKYGEKTSIGTGYTKKQEFHDEGDVWEEDGRSWTIKNGIKRTVTKMDQARKRMLMPLTCPECNKAMKSEWDKKFWTINQSCFDCLVWQEHEIRTAGKWEEYQQAKVSANAKSFLKDVKQGLHDYAEDTMSTSQVTEDGRVEKWQDPNKKVIEEYIDKEIASLEEKVNKYLDNKPKTDE